jgi:hypothetical protein
MLRHASSCDVLDAVGKVDAREQVPRDFVPRVSRPNTTAANYPTNDGRCSNKVNCSATHTHTCQFHIFTCKEGTMDTTVLVDTQHTTTHIFRKKMARRKSATPTF